MIDDNQALIEALEREILADALEKDLGLIRLACAEIIAPRRLMHTVDRLLTYWGYRYFYEDRREITHETGVKSMLGRLVKRKNAENNVHTPYTFIIDDTRYQRINSAVVKMPTYYREFIHYHYAFCSASFKTPEKRLCKLFNLIESEGRFTRAQKSTMIDIVAIKQKIKREQVLSELKDYSEYRKYRNGKTVVEFTRSLKICSSTYNEELKEAKLLAVANGII